MDGKALLTSKTFWINALTLVISVGGTLAGTIPPQFAPYVVAGLAVANIVLRLMTGQPIDSVAGK